MRECSKCGLDPDKNIDPENHTWTIYARYILCTLCTKQLRAMQQEACEEVFKEFVIKKGKE